MKKMNTYLVVAAGIMLLAGAVQSSVVNIDFQPGGDGAVYAVSYSGAGAYDDGNTTWNIAAPSTGTGGDPESGGWFSGGYTLSGLVDSTGVGTGMNLFTQEGDAIAWNSANATYGDFAADAQGLMGDYLQINSIGWTRSVFVEGLTIGQEYAVYLYGSGPFARDTQFYVRVDDDMTMDYGGAQWVGAAATTGGGNSHDLSEGVDYVKFTFTPGTGMDTLWIEYGGVDPDGYASFNGLQIVTIPEPATIGLAGLAGVLIIAIRRRLSV